MEKREWIPGVHYEQGPTCATCHMSATRTLPVTHDVGARISWNLRPPISEKVDAGAKKRGLTVKPWEKRREHMENVCKSCHGSEWIKNWYEQFDNFITLYNNKYGKPATRLYKLLRGSELITSDITFDDKIEFTYFYLWHHEGRRARHGAAMMGPDYAQWHGLYEVAERFYQEFVPELKEIIEENKHKGGQKRQAALELEAELNTVLNSKMHAWYIGKMSAKEKMSRKKAAEEFKNRYAQ